MVDQLTLFSNLEHKNIQLFILHDTSVDEWIRKNHYLRSTPAGAIIRMCFKDSEHRVIGCMMWGHATARRLDQDNLLELTRMCFIDDTQPYVESQCLGMARKHIRKHYPVIKGLITYSSTGAGHEGTVYKADNWYELGKTQAASWETRKGRTNRDLSIKIRWTRSP